MFRIPLISVLLGSASSIKVNSPLGSGLLQKARNLEQDESAYSWMIDYSLKFTSCHTITEFGLDDDDGTSGYVYKQKLVEFKLCSTGECDSTCNGGDYLVPVDDFVKAYADQMVIDRAYACAQVKQNCACENNGDDGDEEEEDEENEEQCEQTCYLNAGLDYCIEQDGDEQGDNENYGVDLDNFINCQEFDTNDDSNNDQYYIGLKCAKDGEGVNVGIFTDSYCSEEIGDDVYLPDAEYLSYKNETMISYDCIDCIQVAYDDEGQSGDEEEDGDDDSDDDADIYEVSEMCLFSYYESVKCEDEQNEDIYYPNTDGCELMSKLYLREDDYEPTDISSMKFSLRFLICLSVIFFAITFRLCFIAQKQQRKLREDEIKWRNRLY